MHVSASLQGGATDGGGYIHPEDAFLQACIDPSYDPDIIHRLGIEDSNCIITQGFIASTVDGHTCLLGRGAAIRLPLFSHP